MPTRSMLLLCALVGGWSIAPTVANAWTPRLSQAGLCAVADLVVIARVSEVVPHSEPWKSVMILEPERVISGEWPSANSIELVLEGGDDGEVQMWAPGQPPPTAGARFQLYLQFAPAGRTTLVGEGHFETLDADASLPDLVVLQEEWRTACEAAGGSVGP